MRNTRIIVPSLFTPETKMSREAGDTRGDATFNVPTWFVSVLKVSMPALVIGVGMYFRIAAVEDTNRQLKVEHMALEVKMSDKSDKILMLEQKTENMKALDALTQTNSAKALERIEVELKSMQADVKDIRAKQLVMYNAAPTIR